MNMASDVTPGSGIQGLVIGRRHSALARGVQYRPSDGAVNCDRHG